MNLFDKLVHAFYQFDGHTLKVRADQQVCVATGSGDRNISARAITDRQVMTILQEIVPRSQAAEISRNGSTTFGYTAPAGPVRVHVERDGRNMAIFAERDVATPVAAPASVPRGGGGGGTSDMGVMHHRFTEEPSRVEVKAPTGGNAIDRLFMTMVESGSSDLHLTSGNPPLYRKDGDIISINENTPYTPDQVRELVWPITPNPNRTEYDECHDTDFAYEIKGVARFRCNLFMDRHGIGGVFRVIPADILTVEKLNISQHVLNLCHLPKGLILVTGPTGSGKSTTLAALIDYINANLKGHIITIEDPIEFVHQSKGCLINQREVGVHTGGFKRALRAALREDPDIVLVGELRDLETVHIAIETAETGHLVFGTLHTNTAPSTVDRLIDQFPADRQAQIRTMLAESLKGVIAQTLCKRKGGGRAAAYEILIVGRSVSNLIREAKTFQIPSIMQTGRSQGMTTLNQSLLELVKNGVIEPQEAYNKAVAKDELKSALQKDDIHIEG